MPTKGRFAPIVNSLASPPPPSHTSSTTSQRVLSRVPSVSESTAARSDSALAEGVVPRWDSTPNLRMSLSRKSRNRRLVRLSVYTEQRAQPVGWLNPVDLPLATRSLYRLALRHPVLPLPDFEVANPLNLATPLEGVDGPNVYSIETSHLVIWVSEDGVSEEPFETPVRSLSTGDLQHLPPLEKKSLTGETIGRLSPEDAEALLAKTNEQVS